MSWREILPVLNLSTNEVHAYKVLPRDFVKNPEITMVFRSRDGHHFLGTSLCGGLEYDPTVMHTQSQGLPLSTNETWELVNCLGCLLLRYDLHDQGI